MNYVENLESLVTELKKKNEILTKKLKDKNGSDKELTAELARVRTEYADLNKKYNILVEKFKQVDAECTNFKVSYDETVLNANKKISVLQKKLRESGNIEDIRKEKDSQIILLNNRVDELVEENSKLRVQSKEEEVKTLSVENKELKEQLKLYKEEHNRYAELLKEKLALETKLALLSTKLDNQSSIKINDISEELSEQLNDALKELEQVQEEKLQLEKDLEEQKTLENEKFRQLQADIRALKEEYEEKYRKIKQDKE